MDGHEPRLEIVPVYFTLSLYQTERRKGGGSVSGPARHSGRLSSRNSLYQDQTALREGGREDLQTILCGDDDNSRPWAERGAGALITGKAWARWPPDVAQSSCYRAAVDVPVLRPLIGLDKQEIVKRAQDLGTYSISIRPYDDCYGVCTAPPRDAPIQRQ